MTNLMEDHHLQKLTVDLRVKFPDISGNGMLTIFFTTTYN